MVSGITVTDYNSLIVHWEVSEPIIGKQTYYHEFELALDRGAEERKSKDKESHRMKQVGANVYVCLCIHVFVYMCTR